MIMSAEKFNKLLNKCYNEYSHEGEFNVKNWKLIIFRKSGNCADCGALVSNKDHYYFTDWHEEDLGTDLKEIMLDAVKYMFSVGFKIKINVAGELYTEDTNFSKKLIKEKAKQECFDAAESLCADLTTLKLNINTENDTFKASFFGGYNAWLAVKNEDDFFADMYSHDVCFSGIMSFADSELAEFTENAFRYRTGFY